MMIICITGLTGSGKSTLAKRLSKRYGFKIVSGGEILKKIKGRPSEVGWWEREAGQSFLDERARSFKYDLEVDRFLLETAEKSDNIIFDSWTMAYLLENALKIYLKADLKVRASRVSKRDGLDYETCLERIKNKDLKTVEIYRKLYGFDLLYDMEPFHLVLDTTRLSEEDVEEIASTIIDAYLDGGTILDLRR